jgi:hypothetical protein
MKSVAEKLDRLRSDLERGNRQLDLLHARRAELRDNLLRTAGAIQVLEELIAEEEPQLTSVEVAAEA